jgi:hypothetical protein
MAKLISPSGLVFLCPPSYSHIQNCCHLKNPTSSGSLHMIELVAEACVGALVGALTILTLLIPFLALSIVCRATAHVLWTLNRASRCSVRHCCLNQTQPACAEQYQRQYHHDDERFAAGRGQVDTEDVNGKRGVSHVAPRSKNVRCDYTSIPAQWGTGVNKIIVRFRIIPLASKQKSTQQNRG